MKRSDWQHALYGPKGFYRREVPSDHFRTASQAGADLVAEALAGLIDSYGLRRVVEVGAGAGKLLTALAARRDDLELGAVELRPRPAVLPPQISWYASLPELDDTPTLLLGWELLDVVPLSTATRTKTGWRGPDLTSADLEWLRRWAPPAAATVEVGLARDEFWSALVDALPRGVALAVDYGFSPQDVTGTPDLPATLTGFRSGRQLPPVADGSCDLTAHVRFDSLAERVDRSRGQGSRLLRQREALPKYGSAAQRPPLAMASSDPAGYLRGLELHGRWQELTDPDGLGAFYWLITEVRASAVDAAPGPGVAAAPGPGRPSPADGPSRAADTAREDRNR